MEFLRERHVPTDCGIAFSPFGLTRTRQLEKGLTNLHGLLLSQNLLVGLVERVSFHPP